MKLIFLNTWDAKQEHLFKEFIEKQSISTDIFCLQEVYEHTQAILEEILKDYSKEYAYALAYEDEDYAQATYVRSSIKTMSTKILQDAENPRGLGIVKELEINGQRLSVLNYHGVSRPKSKLDTEERISEMQRLVSYFQNVSGPKILGGDFNFLPETKAYQLLVDAGYTELIKTHSVPTTRNRLYWDNRPEKHLYSDYVFISSDIKITQFEVPQLEVSDHLPMILVFEI